jgi:ParB family chromosome partitioning protein
MVDNNRLALTMATEISYFNKNVQQWLYEYIKENGMIKQEQIMELRQYREDKNMTQEQLINLLIQTKSTPTKRKKITITERKLNKYFPVYYSQTEIERVIVELLEQWKTEQEVK